MCTSFIFAETKYRAVVRDPGAVRHQHFPVSAGAARKALPSVSMSILTISQLFLPPETQGCEMRIHITLMQIRIPIFI
jgi:hypothetical protein